MKQPFQPKLSDRLAQIAIALDSGNGEAQLAFAAAVLDHAMMPVWLMVFPLIFQGGKRKCLRDAKSLR